MKTCEAETEGSPPEIYLDPFYRISWSQMQKLKLNWCILVTSQPKYQSESGDDICREELLLGRQDEAGRDTPGSRQEVTVTRVGQSGVTMTSS